MILFFSTLFFACESDYDGDGFTESQNDCNDGNAEIHPDATEICDEIDNNCDGLIDDPSSSGARTWYADLDRDGFGDDGLTTIACTQPEGYAPNKWDCNESDASVFPHAEERCDGIDNDCDGEVDENTATDANSWYPDYDGDGFGNPNLIKYSCVQPTDYIQTAGDCNDHDPLVHPAQQESCITDVDDNCDGLINDQNALGCVTYYADLDDDGFPGTQACLCEQDDVYIYTESTDCNDNDASLTPGSTAEDVGFSDLNCDGEVALTTGDADVAYETVHYGDMSDWHNHRTPNDIQAGDIDGDGLSDFAVSAFHRKNTDNGFVYVQKGSEHTTVHELHDFASVIIEGTDVALLSSESIKQNIGMLPISLMDVNNDGLDDIIAMQVTDSDVLEVLTFFAPHESTYTADQASLITAVDLGPVSTGYTLSLSGLKNTASQPAELLIANPSRTTIYGEANGGGFVVLKYNPSTTNWTTEMNISAFTANHKLGTRAENAGDTNGDGISDFVSLSPTNVVYDPFGQESSSLYGTVALYTDRSPYPNTTIVSNVFYRRIANQFAGKGDYNGDGYDDLAFSAIDSGIYKPYAGRTQIVWGPIAEGTVDLEDLSRYLVVGDQQDMKADCPRSVGDVDNDGNDDLLIGTPYYVMESVPARGHAFLWFGVDRTGMGTISENSVRIDNDANGGRTMGYCADNRRFHNGIGDVNGDGFDDFLIYGDWLEQDPEDYDALWLFYGMER